MRCLRTQKKLLSHEQGREKLNPNFLHSSASVVRTSRRCASFSTDVAIRTPWPTQLSAALKRSIAKQRHNHCTKKEKDQKTHFTLMYHSQLYAVKSINLKLSKFYSWSASFNGSYAGTLTARPVALKNAKSVKNVELSEISSTFARL